ncbi:MAG: GAF domain-containing protein [Candidatus Latescibacteria bacterium]|nr:GAF domain-containing protein [Candidatus Latescibacterota bacterium]
MDFAMRSAAVRQVREAVWAMEGEEDIRQVMEVVSCQLRALAVPFDMLGVNVIDRATGSLAVQYYTAVDEQGQERWITWVPLAPVREPFDLFWLAEGPTYRPDLRADDQYGELPGYTHASLPVRSVVDVPFLTGTLAASSYRAHAFDEGHLNALQELAEVLSDGFRRLDDLRALADRLRETEVLARAIAVTAGSKDLEEILRVVVEEATHLAAAERAAVFLYDPREQVLVPRAQVGHHWQYFGAIRLQPGEDAAGEVFASGEPAAFSYFGPEEWNLRPENRILLQLSLQHAAERMVGVAPLRLGGQTIGVLLVATNTKDFTDWDLSLLERLGEQAALAIGRQQDAATLQAGEAKYRRLADEVLAESRLRLEEMQRAREQEKQLLQAQRLQGLGQLATGIAHRFNDLLQGILFNTELCLDPALMSSHQECLEGILDCSLRGTELVRQLMLFEGYDPAAARSPVALGLLVDEVVGICRSTFDRRLVLAAHLPPALPLVQGDAARLRQVLLELLVNARDAVEGAGTPDPAVEVRVMVGEGGVEGMAPGPWVCLQISDNGPGIDPAVQARIYEPFFTTKQQGRGLGLGLAVCQAILRDHQGQIECTSPPGVGAVFSCYLPVL